MIFLHWHAVLCNAKCNEFHSCDVAVLLNLGDVSFCNTTLKFILCGFVEFGQCKAPCFIL